MANLSVNLDQKIFKFLEDERSEGRPANQLLKRGRIYTTIHQEDRYPPLWFTQVTARDKLKAEDLNFVLLVDVVYLTYTTFTQ